MIASTIGIRSVELVEDRSGGPGSRMLCIVPQYGGGEIRINVTVEEVRRLRQALPQD